MALWTTTAASTTGVCMLALLFSSWEMRVEASGELHRRHLRSANWGSDIKYRGQCSAAEKGSEEYYYYCTSDCQANCALQSGGRSSGMLSELSHEDRQFCSSIHSRGAGVYGDDECCCGQDLTGDSDGLRRVDVECNGKTAAEACDLWCGLHLPCIDNGNGELACSFGDLQADKRCYGTGMTGVAVRMQCSEEYCCCDMDT